MRIVVKEQKSDKEVVRDTIIVNLSAIAGLYIINEFMLSNSVSKTITNVFTDAPGF